jgi:arginyl-tRNA synthetase
MNLLSELQRRFAAALVSFASDTAELAEMVRPSQDPKFGDYQANFAMPLGKRLGRPPREIAAEIVAAVDVSDLCEPPEIAGPGFINLRLKNSFLPAQLEAALTDPRLGIAPVVRPRTYVIDFSAPNVAKPMHVGHIRSTVIGDSLYRTLQFLGHQVISDNHLGDWGTQFGMIIYGYRHFRDEARYRESPVDELARLYKLVNRLVDYHDTLAKLPVMRQQIERLQTAVARDAATPLPPGDKKAAQARKRQETQLAAANWLQPKPSWPKSTVIRSYRRGPSSTRTSVPQCWAKPLSCTPAMQRTCGCGTSFCRRVWRPSTRLIAGWACASTIR